MGTFPSDPRKLILIADDDPDGRETLRQLFTHAGYRIAEAADALRAIELAKALAPDLIIMDLGFPELDGWEATRRLKADPHTRSIVILVLSAHVFETDRARAAAAGCDAFLPKPSEMDDILACARRLIGSADKERQGA